jgi:hypothetical protein
MEDTGAKAVVFMYVKVSDDLIYITVHAWNHLYVCSCASNMHIQDARNL